MPCGLSIILSFLICLLMRFSFPRQLRQMSQCTLMFYKFQILWTRGHEASMTKQDGNGQMYSFHFTIHVAKACIKGEKRWHGQNQQTTKEGHFHIKEKGLGRMRHITCIWCPLHVQTVTSLFHQMVSITIRSISPTSSEISTGHLFSCT